MNDKSRKLEDELTLAQQRRALFSNNKVIAVMLTVGTMGDGWISVVPGSFTDDPDPTIKGPGGQVSFLTRKGLYDHQSSNLVLTYTHFIAAVKYEVQEKENVQ